MLTLSLGEFARDEWNRLAGGFADASLMLCWEYAEAKARTGRWRVERGVFVEPGERSGERDPLGVFQALVRPLPGGLDGGLAWVNRGPLWRRTERTATGGGPLPEMMAALGRHYAGEKGMYLRVAPPVEAGVLGPDGSGLTPAGTPGWASATLDLTRSLDALRGGLRANWRNHLNKAERSGLEVRTGDDDTLFSAFLDAHRRLVEERGFATGVTARLLAEMQALLPAGRKMETFAAYENGTLVGSALIAKYGDTCEYLAGNTDDRGRRLNGGQLVLWRAVAAMKEQGFRRLDLGGMDPDLTPRGIYHFKEGLGATPYRLAPELEALGGGLLGGLGGRLVRWRVRRARAAAGRASAPC